MAAVMPFLYMLCSQDSHRCHHRTHMRHNYWQPRGMTHSRTTRGMTLKSWTTNSPKYRASLSHSDPLLLCCGSSPPSSFSIVLSHVETFLDRTKKQRKFEVKKMSLLRFRRGSHSWQGQRAHVDSVPDPCCDADFKIIRPSAGNRDVKTFGELFPTFAGLMDGHTRETSHKSGASRLCTKAQISRDGSGQHQTV